jgi:hypothetical protein
MPHFRFKEDDKQGSSTSLDESDRYKRIRCPKCKWQPGRADRWQCACRHVWNTFDTRGVCPACRFAWQDTQCLRCHEWSPHIEWYAID